MSHQEYCHLCAKEDGEVLYVALKWYVVLVRDGHYPGFCRVVWNEHVKEMTDLSPADRQILMEAVWQVESIVREVMKPYKINLVSLGNMIPHLHWHVIPRYQTDVQFPGAIWARPQRDINVEELDEREALLPLLREALKTRLFGHGRD